MGQHSMKIDGKAPVMGESMSQDAEDVAAALLLAQVEKMLREGQPRQAIVHICEMTGVEAEQAESFVTELKASLFNS